VAPSRSTTDQYFRIQGFEACSCSGFFDKLLASSMEFAHPEQPSRIDRGSPEFQTTLWSVVLAASEPNAQHFRRALDALCATYWYPLYAFVRRQGYGPHEAEDLSQEFFARLIEKQFLNGVSAEKGRFRAFLLMAMKHFLANEWNREHRQKRGGGARLVQLDSEDPETRYLHEPADPVTPEIAYDRRWATTIVQRVVDRLRAEYAAAGKSALFEELKEFLAEKQATPHQEVADRHDISVSAVAVAIHRLRQRYCTVLRDEVAQTVSRAEDIEDEIRYLIRMLGR